MATGDGWFQVERFDDGVVQIGEPGHFENVKSWLVEGDWDAALIDTGMGVSGHCELVATLTSKPVVVLISHGHFDHIGSAHRYERVLVNELEAHKLRDGYPNDRLRPWFKREYMRDRSLPPEFDPETAKIPLVDPTGYLRDGDEIDLGGRLLEVYHTPGHTPGSTSFLDRAGRALFPSDAIGHCSLLVHRAECDPAAYRESLKLLASFTNEVDRVYVPHEASPLEPSALTTIHGAYEQVWERTVPASERGPEADVYQFSDFSFWLPPGWADGR